MDVSSPIQRVVSLDKFKRPTFIRQLHKTNDQIGQKSVSPRKEIDVTKDNSLDIFKNTSLLPKPGDIVRTRVKLYDNVWALTSLVNNASAAWSKAKIIEVSDLYANGFCKVSFYSSHQSDLFLKANQIAFFHPPNVLLKIATKVVALLNYESNTFFAQNQLFSGIIAEPPKRTNQFRYLVFFDSGSCAYVSHNHLFVLVDDHLSPSDDLSELEKKFRIVYFKDYPERAMVKFQLHEKIKVLCNDRWAVGQVEQIDCSLVKLYYKSLNKREWIFRGSFRLQPLYHFAFSITSKSTLSRPKHRAIKKTTEQRCKNFTKRFRPFVQYTVDLSDDEENVAHRPQVAKKSTSKCSPLKSSLNYNVHKKKKRGRPSQNFKYDITLLNIPERLAETKLYVTHTCDPSCLKDAKEDEQLFRNQNPFVIPIIFGWERQKSVYRLWSRSKPCIRVFYIAPCGRRLKSIQEIDYYLNLTKSIIPIDFFTFSKMLRLYVEYKNGLTEKCLYFEEDIANGTENHSLSVINIHNHEKITPNFAYSASRFAGKDVNLNLDPNFLPCCDCKDNCRKRNYCQCQQITVESSYITPIFNKNYVGYKHRRLPYIQMSGIFECNSKCSCNNRCPNRVVQMGMRVRLQIFRTKEKGWGIRTLHDIPKGAFICIYAAELLNDSMADDQGKNEGDEYLADLDYIESIEAEKEDYESAVEEEISSDESILSSDEEQKNISSHTSKEDLASKRIKLIREENIGRKLFVPIRQLFNEQYSYTLDAKRSGNIGRYLNHSCEPNCFVQNVFIDTHDLRFPWVAFFAGTFIPAFSEITWDYHYSYDPESKIQKRCYCRSKRCKGRLL